MVRLATAAAAAFLLVVLLAGRAGAVGFQYGTAHEADGNTIDLAIWYPSDAATSPQPLGLFTQNVSLYSPLKGQALPLIVISHGTGGSAASHYDTALALADAGFVVVAPTHPGDNYKDLSLSFTSRNFIARPLQVSSVIDFMLKLWGGHDHLDPARVGMFGHSAGGATALILLGGAPDFVLAAKFCQDHSDEWGCANAQRVAAAAPAPAAAGPPPDWHHDPRLKAAAIAAPAIGYAFTRDGLAAVTAPIQLWRAENDQIAPNQWNADVIRDAMPKRPDDHLVPRAGHYDFLAPCSEALAKAAPLICESAPRFDRALFHEQFNQTLIAFFKAQLAPP